MASDVRSEAAQALREARARLLTTLAEEVLTWKKTSAEDSSWDGALGFEFQELADRFSPRLATLNQFICNLEEGSSPSAAPQEAPDAAVRTRLFHVDDVAMGMARFLARYRKDRIIDIAVQALDAETVLVNLFLLPSEKLAEGRDQADIIDQWVRGVRETAERRRARRAAPRPPPAPASSPAPTAPTRTPAVPIPRLILAPSPAGVAAAGAGRPAVPSLATTASASRAEQDRPPTPDPRPPIAASASRAEQPPRSSAAGPTGGPRPLSAPPPAGTGAGGALAPSAPPLSAASKGSVEPPRAATSAAPKADRAPGSTVEQLTRALCDKLALDTSAREEALSSALRALSDAERDVLVERYCHDRPLAAIALLRAKSSSWAQGLHARAIRKLRAELAR